MLYPGKVFAVEIGPVTRNAELVIQNAYTIMDTVVLKFVYEENRKKIRDQFQWGHDGAAMICSELGTLEDNYWTMIQRAETEVDWSNTEDVTTYNTLKSDGDELRLATDAFCGFNTNGNTIVPAGVPSSAMITILVRERNHLRSALTYNFTKPDTSRPKFQYWTKNSMNLVEYIKRKFLYTPEKSFQPIDHASDRSLNICYEFGRLATSTTLVWVSKKYLYEDRKIPNIGYCEDRINDLREHAQHIREDFCYAHNNGIGVTAFTIDQGLVDTLDAYKADMQTVRNGCALN